MIKNVSVCSFLIVMLMLLSGCATYYTSNPIQGKVVDSVTKEPVEGVHILVYWPIYTGSHGHREGNIEVKEAVTDENGEYFIDGWGPKKNTLGTTFLWGMQIISTALHLEEPTMVVFKPWYEPRSYRNIDPSIQTVLTPRHADANQPLDFFWNKKTIELVKATDKDEYVRRYITGLSTQTSFLYNNCDWSRAPHFIRILDSHYNELNTHEFCQFGCLKPLSHIQPEQWCPPLSSIFGKLIDE